MKSAKAKLRLKDVNGYLKEKLGLNQKPVKKKTEVPAVWEKMFDKVRTANIRLFLIKDGFITDTTQKLQLKDVREYLKLKLQLQAIP